MYDGTELKAGTAEAEAAVKSFGDATEAAADQATMALRSVDDVSLSGVGQEVEQADSKLKAMGQTASEEIPGALTDLSDSAADAATGLSTAFATLGPAGIAVGVALAGFGILMRKSEEAKEKFKADVQSWTAAYMEGLGRITASSRRAKLEEDLLNPDSVIAQMKEIADRIGVDQQLIISAVYGTPAQRAQAAADMATKLDQLRDRYDTIIDRREHQLLVDGVVKERLQEQFEILSRQVVGYEDLLGLTQDGVTAQQEARDAARDQLEAYDKLGLLTKEEEKKLERMRDRQRELTTEAREMAQQYGYTVDYARELLEIAREIGNTVGEATGNLAAAVLRGDS
jgi:hypothetical protein